MGKVKSQFPQGNFYLRIGKDSMGVIHIRYFINGRYVHKSTGVKIEPKTWDSKSQKIKGSSNPRINNIANQKNLILDEFKNKIDKQIYQYEGLLTYEVMLLIVNGDLITKEKQIKETDFVSYCQDLYRNKYDQGKISYSYWYNKMLLINHFRDYFDSKYQKSTISICDLTATLFEEYKTYRIKTKGNSAISVNKSLVPLYEGIKSLYENGLIEPTLNYKTVCTFKHIK